MSRYADTLASVKSKLAEANARLAEMQETGYGKLSVIDYSLAKQAKITGRNKNIKAFGLGNARTLKKMENLEHQLDLFLSSRWTTPEGREKIRIKAAAGLYKTGKSADSRGVAELTRKQALEAVDFFSTDAYAKALAANAVSSTQLISLVADGYQEGDIEQALLNAVKNKTGILEEIAKLME